MAVWNGTSGNDLIDWSTHPLDGTGDTGHSMNGFGGDDQIKGSNTLSNIIDGGAGNDRVTGGNASDVLLGGDGNDTLIGNGGNDNLTGGIGNDVLYGGAGADVVRGNQGDDEYQVRISDAGIDTAADDLSAANGTGFGGGTSDYIHVLDSAGSTLMLYQNGNDLLVTNAADAADGVINSGVSIYNFFLGGNNVIEYAIGSDGNGYNLTTLLSPSPLAKAAGPQASADHAPVSLDGHDSSRCTRSRSITIFWSSPETTSCGMPATGRSPRWAGRWRFRASSGRECAGAASLPVSSRRTPGPIPRDLSMANGRRTERPIFAKSLPVVMGPGSARA